MCGAVECLNETGVCTPMSTDMGGGCGNCGKQTCTCQTDCTWSAYTCTDEGACAAGTMQSQPCGNCGSQSRTCSASCTWGAWSACSGEGACKPGNTQSQGCGNCGSQSRTATAPATGELMEGAAASTAASRARRRAR
jgi:hypothetical protein